MLSVLAKPCLSSGNEVILSNRRCIVNCIFLCFVLCLSLAVLNHHTKPLCLARGEESRAAASSM